MFIPSILSQGSPEQQAKWLPMCYKLQIIGTYAQTEIGHGTFVRGLETVAVHDPTSNSFIIHSPTLTATKWWPGGLGKTATHAIVMARLFTQGKERGVHGFIVQIRDLETHLPKPGVEIGDIGPKLVGS
jgi:acyl-CoA oxidase